MADKFPSFEYVPALAEYMLKFITKEWACKGGNESRYKYSVHDNAPEKVWDIFSSMSGSYDENYDILQELSEASNGPNGVEDYIDELEAPVYYSQLLDWLGADYTDQRLEMVNSALRSGAETIQQAIAEAWCYCRGEELQEAATALAEYLDSGEDEDEEEEIDTE